MSPPPSIRQITRETLGEVPGWVDKFLAPFNRTLTQIVDLFTGNLTVKENLAMGWLSVTVDEGTAPSPQQVPLKGRVAKGLSVERVEVLTTAGTPGTAPSGPVTIEWAPSTVGGQPGVSISKVWGLATGSRATLTLLVKAE